MNNKRKTKKFHTKNWIAVASYIGGPFAGCYLISENFKSFGDRKKARKALNIGIIVTLILLTAISILPSGIIDQIPRPLIPITYVAVIYSYMTNSQEKRIQEELAHKGGKYSGWRAVFVGLVSLVIALIYLIVVGLTLALVSS